MAEPGNNISREDIRVLILEDNPADAELLQYELQGGGLVFTSKRVETRSQYIQALKHFQPDIILSDYDLPAYSGAQALKARKEICPETPFILVTGAIGEERAIEVLTGGATDYVLKRNLARLLPAVHRALHESYELRRRKEAEAERDRLLRELKYQVQERTEALSAEIRSRQQAEEELRETLESIGEGFIACDRQWRFVYVNSQAERLLGIRKEEMLGKTHREIFSAALGAELQRRLRLAASKGAGDFEQYYEPLGRWFHLKCLPRRAGGISIFFRDVTGQRQKQELLRESEGRFQAVLNNSLDVLYRLNLQTGRYEYISPAAEELTGFALKDLQAQSAEAALQGVHTDDLPAVRAALGRLEAAGQARVEYRRVTKDGACRWVSDQMRLTRDETGRPLYRDGSIRDLTDRKPEDEARRQAEALFSKAFHANPTAMSITERETGRHLEVNEAWLSAFGFRREEVIGHTNVKLGLMPSAEYRRKFLTRCDRAKTGLQREISITRKDGRRITLLTSVIPMIFDNRQCILATGIDITEHKKAEARLREALTKAEDANRELESFSYSVSHDLRAPLRAIDGFSAILLKSLNRKLNEEERRRLGLILDSTRKMNHLIDDLLALSHLGRTELTRTTIDMNRMVEAAWRQQLEGIPERSVSLTMNGLPTALGDESLLRQVLSNLLSNAVKYTRKRKRGTIEVGGEAKGSECVYFVKDNGAGFNMKHRDRLFGVFQRLHPESEYEGTGVGLAIVQRIVHRHGGRVWADGKVGRGATFYFTLPSGESAPV